MGNGTIEPQLKRKRGERFVWYIRSPSIDGATKNILRPEILELPSQATLMVQHHANTLPLSAASTPSDSVADDADLNLPESSCSASHCAKSGGELRQAVCVRVAAIYIHDLGPDGVAFPFGKKVDPEDVGHAVQ